MNILKHTVITKFMTKLPSPHGFQIPLMMEMTETRYIYPRMKGRRILLPEFLLMLFSQYLFTALVRLTSN